MPVYHYATRPGRKYKDGPHYLTAFRWLGHRVTNEEREGIRPGWETLGELEKRINKIRYDWEYCALRGSSSKITHIRLTPRFELPADLNRNWVYMPPVNWINAYGDIESYRSLGQTNLRLVDDTDLSLALIAARLPQPPSQRVYKCKVGPYRNRRSRVARAARSLPPLPRM